MFDTFARLLSSIPTFLLPVFASYKALKTSDPTQLTPWLIYWVVLACALFFESWLAFILVWIPFYSWIRLGFLLYLILPQTQGAKVLYLTHVNPFLQKNEHTIDNFICSAHQRAINAGAEYFKEAVEFLKQNLLGIPPKEPIPPQSPTKFSHTESIMAKFNLSTSRPAIPINPNNAGTTSSVTEFYSLLASAINGATSRDFTLKNLTRNLSPEASSAERLSFISTQRERLVMLLSALEKEASALQTDLNSCAADHKVPGVTLSGTCSGSDQVSEKPKSSLGWLKKSYSEADFEKIEVDQTVHELEISINQDRKNLTGGNWFPWIWRPQTEKSNDVNLKNSNSGLDEGKNSGCES